MNRLDEKLVREVFDAVLVFDQALENTKPPLKTAEWMAVIWQITLLKPFFAYWHRIKTAICHGNKPGKNRPGIKTYRTFHAIYCLYPGYPTHGGSFKKFTCYTGSIF